MAAPALGACRAAAVVGDVDPDVPGAESVGGGLSGCCVAGRLAGGMAGGEKRAGRLAAEPLLAPMIRVTGAEATSYSMTPRSPGGPPTGPASTGGPRRSPTPDDVPAGGVYTFVRSPREAAEVADGTGGRVRSVDRAARPVEVAEQQRDLFRCWSSCGTR